ncbi:hypothetical protein K8W59_19615 [Nocardioides rotundus]|uniref:hypothetical protein n=1 Tax=Nocardioides rotundus TaxID=1774216 RepID=UPI001CBB7771|nr:hypothetical protein [Nocardioides rotundus]UAL29899.1 hypothetical protein K8W59_19615 [Nocardioides rotundus]
MGIPTVAAIATAVYTTGGRGALERRVMRQELAVVALLPAGDEKDVMEQAVRDRAAIYAARRLGQEPFTPRQHAIVLGFGGAGLIVGYAGTMLSQTASARNALTTVLASLALLMMLVGFTLAASAFTAWGSRVFIASRTQSRRLSVAAHRERLAEHIATERVCPRSTLGARPDPVGPAQVSPARRSAAEGVPQSHAPAPGAPRSQSRCITTSGAHV